MAIFNEILVGRYNRALQKLFAIKGGPPVRQLGGEVLPIVQLFRGAEDRYLESWFRFGIIADQPGAVGNNTGFRLRNPTGSNVIAVVEKIYIQNINAAANLFSLAINGGVTVNLGALTPTFNRRFDSRGQQQTNMIISTDSNYGPVLNTTVAALSVPANDGREWLVTDLHEIPLVPGDAWDIRSVNTNSEIQVTCWWRERFLEESERT